MIRRRRPIRYPVFPINYPTKRKEKPAAAATAIPYPRRPESKKFCNTENTIKIKTINFCFWIPGFKLHSGRYPFYSFAQRASATSVESRIVANSTTETTNRSLSQAVLRGEVERSCGEHAMWSAALLRFIRRRIVLAVIFCMSLTYCLVNFMQKVSSSEDDKKTNEKTRITNLTHTRIGCISHRNRRA